MSHRGCGCCGSAETCAEKSWAFTSGAAFNTTDWSVSDVGNVSYVSDGVIEVTDDTLTPNSTQENEAFQLILAFNGIDSGSSLTIRMDNGVLADQTLVVDPFNNTMTLNSNTAVNWGVPQNASDWVTVSMGFNTARTWGYVWFGSMLHPWFAKTTSPYDDPSATFSKYQDLYCYDQDSSNTNYTPNFEIEVTGTLQLQDYLADSSKGVRQIANTHTFSGGVPVLACPYVLPSGGNYATADRMPGTDSLTLTGYDHTPPTGVTNYTNIWAGYYWPSFTPPVPVIDNLDKTPGGEWRTKRAYVDLDKQTASDPVQPQYYLSGMTARWTDSIHEPTATAVTPYPAFQQRNVMTLQDLFPTCAGYVGSVTNDRDLVNAANAITLNCTLTRPGSCRSGQSSTIQWAI